MVTTTSDGEAAVLEKILALPAFRDLAMRLHDLIKLHAPHLELRLW